MDHGLGRPAGLRGVAPPPWTVIETAVRALEETDLRPGPVVDMLFGELVRAALALPAGHPGIASAGARVRDLCARGEAELEVEWARRVVAEPAALRDFPYLANYDALARGEWAALIAALGRRPRRAAFVGSGPLPLTALSWRDLAPDVSLTCVDRGEDAVAFGHEVATALGGPAPTFVRCDAADLDVAAFDVVVLAALVGESAVEKRALVGTLGSRLRGDAVLGVRSVPADGRQLLYPRLPVVEVPAGLQVRGEWLPPMGVINSLLVLGRAGHGRW